MSKHIMKENEMAVDIWKRFYEATIRSTFNFESSFNLRFKFDSSSDTYNKFNDT